MTGDNMTLDEFLQSNGNTFTDADLATLADWANDQVQELYKDDSKPSGKWTRPHALIREGADLLLRRRAKQRRQMDYRELRQQLGDYSSTFYGPYPCKTCGCMIVKLSWKETMKGDSPAWEVPSLVSMAGVPQPAWVKHNCTTLDPDAIRIAVYPTAEELERDAPRRAEIAARMEQIVASMERPSVRGEYKPRPEISRPDLYRSGMGMPACRLETAVPKD
jgi:hypothetical protein